ncbi:hypothetical protein MAR_020832 [Mya arenaria]|uniref:C6 domain-containing protein n=1 Tax=Mya arenaria TaxID=6604 RepID=A0ABY7E5Z4_MYAAR|nr:hypothetical protein MAR_020832 [Mya arenaria]
MRTFFFLAVSLFSCVTQTSGGEISPKLTPLNSSHDCQNCLFTELGVPFTFKCNLAKDTPLTVVEFKLGSNIGFTGQRESTGVYVYRSYTIREEIHLLNVRCIASVASSTFSYETEETNATLYVTRRSSRESPSHRAFQGGERMQRNKR